MFEKHVYSLVFKYTILYLLGQVWSLFIQTLSAWFIDQRGRNSKILPTNGDMFISSRTFDNFCILYAEAIILSTDKFRIVRSCW